MHVAVKDFRIVLNESVAYSGSAVSGNVILEVEEPKNFKQISVVVGGAQALPNEVGAFFVASHLGVLTNEIAYPRSEFYDVGNTTVRTASNVLTDA